jgi:phage terminase large subunit
MEEAVIALSKQQAQALLFKTPYCAAIAGHRGGKSYVGSVWAAKKIAESPKLNGLICAPTYPILRQATLDTFFKVMPQYRKYYKEHKSVIELPTGGNIFVRSTDDPLGLEGMTISWCWMDEAGMMSKLVWDIVRARLSIAKGQCFITTTPYNLGWLYQEFYLKWKNKLDNDISVFTWKSTDNSYFPKDFADKERKRLSPQEYARRYEAQFTKMEGLVYDLPMDRILQSTDQNNMMIQNSDLTIAGVDWGFRNPSAICVLRFKDGVWYVVDEWYQTEKTTKQIIERLKYLIEKWRINEVYADYAEPDRLEECRQAGVSINECLKDLTGGVSYIQQLIRERRLFVFNYCKNFLDEINAYRYAEGKEGKPYKDEPEKLNDHLMDALRYAIHTNRPNISYDIKQQARIAENRIKNKSSFT